MAQDVIISEYDCGTVDGIYVGSIVEAGEIIEPLRDRIIGRVSLEKIKDYEGNVIVDINQEITEDLASSDSVRRYRASEDPFGARPANRSAAFASCATDATWLPAAWSKSAKRSASSRRSPSANRERSSRCVPSTSVVRHRESPSSPASKPRTTEPSASSISDRSKSKAGDLVVMNRNGSIAVVDDKGREKERYAVVYGAKREGRRRGAGHAGPVMVEWDPYTFSILTEIGGTVQFKDLQEGVTLHEEVDEVTGLSRTWSCDSPDEKRQPAIVIKDGKGSKRYLMPSRAHLMVQDGDTVHPGDVLAKIPRETTKTKDITGGLPRVVELFEARKPRETAVITEIDGIVKFGEVAKGQRKIYVVSRQRHREREYSVPRGVHINVQEGERVKAGEPLMDGPLNPHDILAVLGEKELQAYLVNEIQEVYRLQGVNISDKHIEVIVRQMMRWVKVEDVGDTEFLLEEQVDKFRFREENETRHRARRQAGHRPSAAARNHQGVAVDRIVHLRGIVPGDHARAHRSLHSGQGGSPARPERERHRRTPHSGRYRHGVLPQRAPLAGNGRGRSQGAGGGHA